MARAAKRARAGDDGFVRRTLGIPDDEPDDVAALEALGFTRERIAASAFVHEFGPRAAISTARRLQRAIRIKANHVRAGSVLLEPAYYEWLP